MNQLAEVIDSYLELPPEDRGSFREKALEYSEGLRWVPNPGPQTLAYYSEADELFYGGQAGPGKTDLILGLAANCHRRSLIVREYHEDAKDVAERFLEIMGTRKGWNGQDKTFRDSRRFVRFGGLPHEEDKQRHKGKPYDFYGMDEIGDVTESQFAFITAWNRSTIPDQRCRVVVTGNPPTRVKGLWVIKRWAPWLDKKHPLYGTLKEGELLWFLTNEAGDEEYVEGPGPYMIHGKETYARSRTFIRGELSDNPDLEDSGYDAVLATLPGNLRDAYRYGQFDAALQDEPQQLIPTEWIYQAQQRWTERPLEGIPMCAISLDPAQGGANRNVIARRHDGWYAPLIKIPGKDTPLGEDCSGRLVAARKDGCAIIVDCGGGYGGSVIAALKENGLEAEPYVGAEASAERTDDEAALKFTNRRSEAWWRFREALDPSHHLNKEFGSPIMLPPDQKLLADLTAPTYKLLRTGITVESKEDIVKRSGGVSPDEGDAVVMAWAVGAKAISHASLWREAGDVRRGVSNRHQVVLGHSGARRAAHTRRN